MKEDNDEIERTLKAQPSDGEPDRSSIKWPKRKKPTKIKRKTTPSTISGHPGTQDARKVCHFIDEISTHAKIVAKEMLASQSITKMVIRITTESRIFKSYAQLVMEKSID